MDYICLTLFVERKLSGNAVDTNPMGGTKLEPQEIAEEMRDIEANEFEQLVADIWGYLGYDTETTQTSSDRGVDVIASREFPYKEKILIQAKRYSSTLSGPELREYVALSKRDGVDTVIVVSTAGFTKQAKQEAEEYNIKLINGISLGELIIREDIIELVRQYSGNVESTSIERKRSPKKNNEGENSFQTLVAEGEYITIELVGYDNLNVKFGDKNEYEMKECTVICLYVKNKLSSGWHFGGSYDVSITSSQGFSYKNPQNCWSSSQNKLSPWINQGCTINRDSKSRIVLFYTSKFTPAKIEYQAKTGFVYQGEGSLSKRIEKITILIEDSIRDEVNMLPESLSVDSVYLHS
jgi:hypothetical protein